LVTDLAFPAVEVWRAYRGRADAENRIKELKADFGLDAFSMRKFWATEAALAVAMLAYNLMSLFR
jgi:IS4 transposase